MNKNHNLDNLIIDASFNEFFEKGFDKASLRKIATNAGVTVGAIYTRYESKDKLFYSLVEPLLHKTEEVFSSLKNHYFTEDINFIESLKLESNTILHLLFDNYNMAYLLLCKSKGSKLEGFFDNIINEKIKQTIVFMKNKGIMLDEGLVNMLINCQFNSYYQIIANGYKLDEAKTMMNQIMQYHTGGWLTILGIK